MPKYIRALKGNTVLIIGPAVVKSDLRTIKIQTSLRIRIFDQGICCSPSLYRDLVEDIVLIAKILARRVAVKTGLGRNLLSAGSQNIMPEKKIYTKRAL